MRASILSRKYDGRRHHERTEVELLIDSPMCSISFSCGSPFVHHMIGQQWQEPGATLYYFPKDAFYNVYWESSKGVDNRDVDLVYCHIATPVKRCEGRLEYIDLDLDVIMRNTGKWLLDDEDEFVENAARWKYPADIVAQAREAADWLMAQAKLLKPPFGFRTMEEVLSYYGSDYVDSQEFECIR